MKTTVLKLSLITITFFWGMSLLWAQPQKPLSSTQTTDLALKVGLQAHFYAEGADRVTGVISQGHIKFKHSIGSVLVLKFDGGFEWANSRVQVRSRADYSDAIVDVNEAVVEYTPLAGVRVVAGAVSQGRVQEPLLLSNRSFPGLSLDGEYESESSAASLQWNVTQSIPTSKSFNIDRSDLESTPSLTTAHLSTTYKVHRALELSTSSTYFDYQNLPSVVALRSAALGNSIDGSQNNSQFIHGFSGYVLGVGACVFCTEDSTIRFSYKYLQNIKASENNKGNRIGFYWDQKITNIYWGGSVEYYFKDRDVVPAAYSNLYYGGNNRIGTSLNMYVGFLDNRIKLKGSVYKNNVITHNPHQQDSYISFVKLETEVAKF